MTIAPASHYGAGLDGLRELGGARRIVEDEVRDRAGRYGAQRRRGHPVDPPIADRAIMEPMELTSRVWTDLVAKAKQHLETPFGGNGETVDIALATTNGRRQVPVLQIKCQFFR